MRSKSDTPNVDEIAFWNGRSGEKWVQYQILQDRMLGPHGERAIEAANISPGERVIDIGCGCGDTTLQVARRVGPGGHVSGLDVSEVMLAHAEHRAAEEPELNIDFEVADAEVHRFEPNSADLIFSRFGVMFFADPVAAFSNMRAALTETGRLAFVCWQPLSLNPWVKIPFDAAARHIDMPAPSAPTAPGPFAFSDPDRVESILRDAGFEAIRIEAYTPALFVGETVDGAVKYLMQMTPIAGPVAEAGLEMRTTVSDELRPVLQDLAKADGVYAGSASWIVTARAGPDS